MSFQAVKLRVARFAQKGVFQFRRREIERDVHQRAIGVRRAGAIKAVAGIKQIVKSARLGGV